MKSELETLIEEELVELNRLVFDVLEISDSSFRKYGTSGFMVELCERDESNPGMLEEECKRFELLCKSVPNISPHAIRAASMAYTVFVINFDKKYKYAPPSIIEAMRTLSVIAMARGIAMGVTIGNPATTELKRKKLLSEAGLRGARSRNQPYAKLKEWALENGAKLGASKDVARRLAAQLPAQSCRRFKRA
ncbi:hypothetical protein BH10PSE16_BH10PSE16_37140 [soil metagenome]